MIIKCSKCHIDKSSDEYEKRKDSKTGYRGCCNVCRSITRYKWCEKNKQIIKEKDKIRSKLYRKNNHDKISKKSTEKSKIYRKNNSEKIYKKQKEWQIKNVEYVRNYRKIYRQKPEIKIKEKEYKRFYEKNKKESNPLYRLKTNLRTSTYQFIKNSGYIKKSKTTDILGCSFEEFKQYLESKWEYWMNWENYGNPKDGILEPNKTWDIDHIVPLSSAKSEEELIKLCHYINLQPLCSFYNRVVKKDNY